VNTLATLLAISNWERFFTARVLTATILVAVNYAVPYVLAALGETFGQRSGVYNLGVDGVMLLGAFGAYRVVLGGSSPWLGCLVAIAVGVAMGLLIALANVTLGAEQGISGIGFFLFGLGLSDLLFERWVGTPRPLLSFFLVHVPGLSARDQVTPLAFVALAAIPIAAFIFRKTPFGLNLTAVGENPDAADSLGISVHRVRYATQAINGGFSGLAGAALVLYIANFTQNLTAGMGFTAVALVYFGAWRPVGVLGGALLFGGVQALVSQWKALGIIPSSWGDFAAMAPAVVTILVLVLVAGRARQPSALGRPFVRGH
jgi:simple sugar transport system permease protein